MRLYKRNVEMIIGESDGSALSVKDLYMQFEIKKTLSSTPNEGTATIYNLSDFTETRIKDSGTRIRIKAGYNGEYGLLFDGDVRKVERDKQPPERQTVITLGGNYISLTEAVSNVSYQGPIPVGRVLLDTIDTFGLAYAGLDSLPIAVLNDFSFTGRTADLFDEILTPLGVQWYEDSGFVLFSEVGTSTEEVVLLNASSGLIGSPAVTDEGIKAVSLLNHNIRPGGRVKVESELVTGIYKVTQLVYRGDNREGDFFTEFLGAESE